MYYSSNLCCTLVEGVRATLYIGSYRKMGSELNREMGKGVRATITNLQAAYQFILVEEGDEGARDDLSEATDEAADLLPNGLGHSHLCHQPHILLLPGTNPIFSL